MTATSIPVTPWTLCLLLSYWLYSTLFRFYYELFSNYSGTLRYLMCLRKFQGLQFWGGFVCLFVFKDLLWHLVHFIILISYLHLIRKKKNPVKTEVKFALYSVYINMLNELNNILKHVNKECIPYSASKHFIIQICMHSAHSPLQMANINHTLHSVLLWLIERN